MKAQGPLREKHESERDASTSHLGGFGSSTQIYRPQSKIQRLITNDLG